MKRSWRGIAVLLGWSVLAGGLCGCDPSCGADGSAVSAAGLSAPAPARFGSPQQPQLSPAAAGLMAGARELAAIGPADGSSPDADLRGVQEGRVRFDGSARQALAPAVAGKPMVVRAGMAIDTDGKTANYDPRIHNDPYRQARTSLRYSDGSSLNPAEIPYVVVPKRHQSLLGDLVEVEYGGRRVMAVVGDCGPRFGEGSVALAESLGIPASGTSGGVSGGVTYSFYPGSGRSYSGPRALKAALAGPSDTRLASL
ncbi:MAG: glycoside hydrolase family 75 protein [Elusimicrobia bacterium]|nr:glycoside hydrolase family 75 protein [Elusimicrobiota bacterium]